MKYIVLVKVQWFRSPVENQGDEITRISVVSYDDYYGRMDFVKVKNYRPLGDKD